MIHSISVRTSDSPWSVAAQEHALRFAAAFNADIVSAGIWKQDTEHGIPGNEDIRDIIKRPVEGFAERVRETGLNAETFYFEKGIFEGLDQLSRETDLLVLGIPDSQHSDLENSFLRLLGIHFLSILNEARSTVLAVKKTPDHLRNILIHNPGGLEGRHALRLGGMIAEKFEAGVHVLVQHTGIEESFCPEIDISRKYLSHFDIRISEVTETTAPAHDPGGIMERFHELNPDLIVIGEDPRGPIKAFFESDATQGVVNRTDIPVLIAR